MSLSYSARLIRVHLADPEFRAGACPLKLCLTYEGPLHVRKAHKKQEIRRIFHSQLKRLWEVNRFLSKWAIGSSPVDAVPMAEFLQSYVPSIGAYRFVPLVTEKTCVECAIDFRILRPTDTPGNRSDLDNQVKFLVDALKIPGNSEELGRFKEPSDGETLFFTLVHDDRLISKISSTNEELLQPVCGKDHIDHFDVRVFVDVHIRPTIPTEFNTIFFSEDDRVWDHKYDENLPVNLQSLSGQELRAKTTQLVLRIRALALDDDASGAVKLKKWMSDGLHTDTGEDFRESVRAMWLNDMHPKAFAFRQELCRRVYGEGPYPEGRGSTAIDAGMLAGVSPLNEAANELERLIRSLA